MTEILIVTWDGGGNVPPALLIGAELRLVLEASPEEYRAMKEESIRLIAAHDIQRTLSTFESLYRGKPVTDPVTDVAPVALPE